ncbi:hypothetical protein [Paenibacillus oleatilyticus]|uniref:Restriction endonuclease n=1 Tax=Paenibacillus oleatilyticus TaxID=2594886 RepID=A0ABV4UYW6_9BACL
MKRVPLVQYDMPRILTFDFSKQEVEKLQNAGYNVHRGSTGVLPADQGEYFMPCAITDVEILLFNVRDKAISEMSKRKMSEGSIEEMPFLLHLMEEVWKKGGVTILFVNEGVSPLDLDSIGVERTGVLNSSRKYMPSSSYQKAKHPFVEPEFPKYRGNSIRTTESVVAQVYQRFVKSAQHLVLAVQKDITLFGRGMWAKQIWHIQDDSVDGAVLCLELQNDGIGGSIILLPTFEAKNTDVVLAIIKEYLSINKPHLFAKSNHEWLEDYKPVTVKNLEHERDEFVQQSKKTLEEYNEKINETHEAINWMDHLLVGKDDIYAEAVGLALTYLGFDVTDVDKLADTGNRKREDFRIHDGNGYFALVEAKATERGANQQMIQDTQAHQLRYSREYQTHTVPALLVVNHSCKNPPDKRSDFYKAKDIQEGLIDSAITAIDSVFLHDLCQKVLAGELSVQEARSTLKAGSAVLAL